MDQAVLISLLTVTLARSMERFMLILAGALVIYLRYRLFIHMPLTDKTSGQLKLPGG